MLRRLLPLALLFLASCTSYGFVRQATFLRHDVKRDRFELVILSLGLLEHSSESLERVWADAKGDRHVILGSWPMEFDFDSLEERARASDHPLADRAAALLGRVEVRDAGLFRGTDGEACLYQILVFPKAREALDLLNASINHTLIQHADAAGQEGWDAASQGLALEFARAEGEWYSLDGSTLVVRAPMTDEALVATLQPVQPGGRPFTGFFAAVADLRLSNGLQTQRLEPQANGWIRMYLRSPTTDQPALRMEGPLAEGPRSEIVRQLLDELDG